MDNLKKNASEQENEVEINLMELVPYLFHWLWLLLIVGLFTGAIGFSVSAFFMTPKYQSTTKVYILNKSNKSDNVTYSDTQLATNLTKDFEEMIKSRYVIETVIENFSLNESYETLAGNVSVSNTTDTRIIGISVKDSDPARAQFLANAIRDVAAIHLKNVMDLEAVNVVEEANLPNKPVEPSKKKFTMIGFAIGFIICGGILVLRYYLDDSIKTSEDIEKYLDMTVLASIPIFEEEGNTKKKKKAKRA